MRFHLRAILVGGLTIGLLAGFFWKADLGQVWAEIKSGDPALIALAVCVTMVTYALRALRWQYLLRPIGRTHFGVAFRTTVIGFAASFLLPLRPGEFLRPYLLARREGLSGSAAFATIALERVLDMVAVLLLFTSFVFVFGRHVRLANPGLFSTVIAGGIVSAVAAVAALLSAYLMTARPEIVNYLSRGLGRVLSPRLAGMADSLLRTFAEGLGVVRSPRRLALAVAFSLPLWLSISAGIWLVSLAFHIDMPYTGSFLPMTILVAGVLVPTPGAVGGFHWAYQIAVTSFYAVPTDRAKGAALVLWAVSFLPVTLFGIVFMAQEGLSLSRVQRLARQATGVEKGPA
jgi:uncharacterized protein (TIRG00374 family)